MTEHLVYLHRSPAGRVLYVGCTKDLARRTAQHRYGSRWWPFAASVEVDSAWPSPDEAARRERELIAEHEPPGNVFHNRSAHLGESASDAVARILGGREAVDAIWLSGGDVAEVYGQLMFADEVSVMFP